MNAAEQETDARYLREALDLARKGDAQASPNPLVGAVLVRDGQVVGRGFHTWAGVKHAEILALEEAGERARGATLYINLEPCTASGTHGTLHRRADPAGVARVVAALEDPNPLVAGDGLRQLRAAGIQAEIAAAFSAEAEKLNEAFVHFMRTRLPLVTLKTALTLDGKIAAPDDNRGWITSEKARAHVQQLRHRSDAILTGIGTVLADDCLLTDRSGLPRSRPLLRIVLDSRLRLAARFADGPQRRGRCAGGGNFGGARRTPQSARKPRRPRADSGWARRALRFARRHRGSRQQQYLSVLDRGRRQGELGRARNGRGRQGFLSITRPRFWAGSNRLSMAGGVGRRRRADAIRINRTELHRIAPDEFAVEGYIVKEA
jgi:diaminohydroxyphosphoribosylaminopyrimidine deaminase/5-amino-6-(5-phosphoribosylamino)uracil reductase